MCLQRRGHHWVGDIKGREGNDSSQGSHTCLATVRGPVSLDSVQTFSPFSSSISLTGP